MQKLFLKYGIYFQSVIVIFFFLQCSLLIAIALMPSVYLGYRIQEYTADMPVFYKTAGTAFSIAAGYFLYGLSIIFVIGLFRNLTFSSEKEGIAPYFSIHGLKWANYNSLILTVRFTFMDFFRLTPFNVLFYKLMGAKIGKGVQINTKVVADACLLEIGDNSVIGGDATLICHSIEGNKLIIMPTKIGKNVTIGLMSVILPGVSIGDGAIVAAGSVVPKGTTIPPKTIWAGVPAKQVKELKND